jgi:hypothetical protein
MCQELLLLVAARLSTAVTVVSRDRAKCVPLLSYGGVIHPIPGSGSQGNHDLRKIARKLRQTFAAVGDAGQGDWAWTRARSLRRC